MSVTLLKEELEAISIYLTDPNTPNKSTVGLAHTLKQQFPLIKPEYLYKQLNLLRNNTEWKEALKPLDGPWSKEALETLLSHLQLKDANPKLLIEVLPKHTVEQIKAKIHWLVSTDNGKAILRKMFGTQVDAVTNVKQLRVLLRTTTEAEVRMLQMLVERQAEELETRKEVKTFENGQQHLFAQHQSLFKAHHSKFEEEMERRERIHNAEQARKRTRFEDAESLQGDLISLSAKKSTHSHMQTLGGRKLDFGTPSNKSLDFSPTSKKYKAAASDKAPIHDIQPFEWGVVEHSKYILELLHEFNDKNPLRLIKPEIEAQYWEEISEKYPGAGQEFEGGFRHVQRCAEDIQASTTTICKLMDNIHAMASGSSMVDERKRKQVNQSLQEENHKLSALQETKIDPIELASKTRKMLNLRVQFLQEFVDRIAALLK